ncbi:unnamed protein product, partial [Laminaria digitata]
MGVDVKAMSAKMFGSSGMLARGSEGGGGGGGGLGATGGLFGSTGRGRAAEVEAVAPPVRGPIGGPWDEEEILKWVRDVTKMDIDPECGVAYGLKDGVALCRLMSKLQPGVSMAAPSDSSLAYKQRWMANICIFLRSCRTLGLGESILFETADLYEEKSIPSVVKTLVALGETVPRTCPSFKGPQLNMARFAWTTTVVAPAPSSGAASSGQKGSRRSFGSTAGVGVSNKPSGVGGGVGVGTWPRPGGNAGTVGGGGGGAWRKGLGDEQLASSGEEEDS